MIIWVYKGDRIRGGKNPKKTFNYIKIRKIRWTFCLDKCARALQSRNPCWQSPWTTLRTIWCQGKKCTVYTSPWTSLRTIWCKGMKCTVYTSPWTTPRTIWCQAMCVKCTHLPGVPSGLSDAKVWSVQCTHLPGLPQDYLNQGYKVYSTLECILIFNTMFDPLLFAYGSMGYCIGTTYTYLTVPWLYTSTYVIFIW